MQNFELYNPTRMIFGRGVNEKIGAQIKAQGINKVLLVAGGGSIRRNGVYETVCQSLLDAGISWAENWGVQPNPTLAKAEEILRDFRLNQCEALLAVGGGSVIDTCKAVAAGACADSIWSVYENPPAKAAKPIFTVLTISATGTEMNELAVISNEEELKKWGVYGEALFPKVTCLDPSVQATLPWRQTVNGAVDALSHSMEQYFSSDNAETIQALIESVMRSIIKSANILKDDPENYEARASLAWGATLGLNDTMRCGSGRGDWATHGIEHALSALNPDVAHAEGLAVIFPAWITVIGSDQTNDAFSRWAKNVWGKETLAEAVEAYKAQLKAWGHPTTLGEIGFTEGDFDEIIRVATLRGDLGRVEVLSKERLRQILQAAL